MCFRYAPGRPERLAGVPTSGLPESRPSAGRKADSEVFPIQIRPKSAPEVPFPARTQYCYTILLPGQKHYCVT